jgi:hypothetical protein
MDVSQCRELDVDPKKPSDSPNGAVELAPARIRSPRLLTAGVRLRE